MAKKNKKKKTLYHCLTCTQFNYDIPSGMFECKLGNVEPDDLIYAFERKICDKWVERNDRK